MTLLEGIAVFLALVNQASRSPERTVAFNQTWDIIWQEFQKTLREYGEIRPA
jgi:hypothetical protein